MRPLLFLLPGFILQAADHVSASAVTQEAQVVKPQIALAPGGADQPQDAVGHSAKTPPRLRILLDALGVMQDKYFDTFTGTWPTAIDWTAAVLGTHVSATLSTLVSSLNAQDLSCSDRLTWENTINKYFAQTSVFYFGENAFGLRNQAYDDMLWVVLGWLESIKFMRMYSLGYWEANGGKHGYSTILRPVAGIPTSVVGMNWNPALTPYKNAITNELFVSASISMYLYFPGDNNTSPYLISGAQNGHPGASHDPLYLKNAIKAYKWLQESKMQNSNGLYQDGFHITGWKRYPNGSIDLGSRQCDLLNPMIYTYNQAVVLTASKGLWMATGERSYLDEGHALVDSVIGATGWPKHDQTWHGLGRGGLLEEFCDHSGYCSQDGQTFKGIFFSHLSEFCRPLWQFEEDFIGAKIEGGLDQDLYQYHKAKCATYRGWVRRNADAASMTKDPEGLFGMWWGRAYPDAEPLLHDDARQMHLPRDAVDYMNDGNTSSDGLWRHRATSDSSSVPDGKFQDVNDRGRGRSVETQSGDLLY